MTSHRSIIIQESKLKVLGNSINLLSFVAFEVLTVVTMNSSGFDYITLCSLVEVSLHFGGIYHLQAKQEINRQQAGFACPVDGLKMSKMSVDFHQTTWHYVPEVRTLNVVFCSDK